MHLRHVAALLALFAWQVAPSSAPDERPHRLRLWLGAGRSSFDYAFWGTAGGQCLQWDPGCNCNLSECGCYCTCLRFAPTYPARRESRPHTSASGIQVDLWPSSAMRISVASGRADQEDRWTVEGPGTYRGGLVAWEGPLLGLGGGAASGPDHAGYDGLSAYARYGSRDGPQLRAELRTPTATPGVTGWARAGFAYNQRGRRDDIAVFLGVGAVEAEPDTSRRAEPGSESARATRPALFLDVAFPLGRKLDVFGRGHLGKQARGGALGLALRVGT